MKYRYAQTADGATVDIVDLSRERPREQGQFICFSCKRDLIPVLGLRREKHFRHRFEGEVPCTRETYLHTLAKKQIVDGFVAAVQSQRPYTLTLPVERHCTRWMDELGVTCVQAMGWHDFDLTHYFDRVEEEAGVDGFVSDVLLTSSKSNETLLIEVAVTHRCEANKINSGLRIVEVSVTVEDQIRPLSGGIDTRSNNVSTHNLRPQPPQDVHCRANCGTELAAFFVYKSGKTRMLTDIPSKIVEERKRADLIYNRVGRVDHPFVDYRSEALRALTEGVPIKCCLLCRYAGFDTLEKPVFCKIRKFEVGVNEAATCSHYRPEYTEFGSQGISIEIRKGYWTKITNIHRN
ncbi:hypothetical protein PWG15_14685 [Ensifer adhaerens]|uniref:hypothetical protein n=1 Tax=Ensifer adhaerens TaxID=106592 RepID=UPI0023A96FEF|nr:hypothetical protein [Ensifer adhaerens]WDZ75848.1 hypothetical protein PWG15_14685 [Ensifer adhaerens]